MQLEELRKNKGLTYEELAVFLGFKLSTTFRICKHSRCITLREAHVIVKKSGGVVSYEDLLDTLEVC